MEPAPHAKLAARFRADPGPAGVRVAVSTTLEEGMACGTTARGHETRADEPRSLGGTDGAQSPVELLLTSLATCQAVTAVDRHCPVTDVLERPIRLERTLTLLGGP